MSSRQELELISDWADMLKCVKQSAPKPLTIPVTKRHSDIACRNSAVGCAIADGILRNQEPKYMFVRAGRKHFGAQLWGSNVIHMYYAPGKTYDAIRMFDKTGVFPPGTYTLSPLSEQEFSPRRFRDIKRDNRKRNKKRKGKHYPLDAGEHRTRLPMRKIAKSAM